MELAADLLQFRLTLLREACREHVTAERVETLGQLVAEAAVTASDEYVSVRVSVHSRETDDMIDELVDDEDAKQCYQTAL